MQLAQLKSKETSSTPSSSDKRREVKPSKKEEEKAPALLKKLLDLCKKGVSSEIKQAKGKKKTEEDPSIFITVEPLSPFLHHETHAKVSASTVSPITEQTLKIFDKMCSEMTRMHTEACTKTEITLRSLSLRNSPLYGSKITIEEFSTAPKLFNVTIHARAPVTEAVNAQMAGFMNFLQTKERSFGINRIDTALLSGKNPLKKEKKKSNDQDEKRHP